MSNTMDEAGRFLRDRLGSSAPKANTSSATGGAGSIVINGNMTGDIIVRGRSKRFARRQRQRVAWLAIIFATAIAALALGLAWSSTARADVATTATVCETYLYEEALVTSCVAADIGDLLSSIHVSSNAAVAAALPWALNACFDAIRPHFSRLIQLLPDAGSPYGTAHRR